MIILQAVWDCEFKYDLIKNQGQAHMVKVNGKVSQPWFWNITHTNEPIFVGVSSEIVSFLRWNDWLTSQSRLDKQGKGYF